MEAYRVRAAGGITTFEEDEVNERRAEQSRVDRMALLTASHKQRQREREQSEGSTGKRKRTDTVNNDFVETQNNLLRELSEGQRSRRDLFNA